MKIRDQFANGILAPYRNAVGIVIDTHEEPGMIYRVTVSFPRTRLESLDGMDELLFEAAKP